MIASHLSKEAYDILFTLNQHGIFQRLQLCRWIQNDGAYIDYEDMNEFLNDYQIKIIKRNHFFVASHYI